MAGKRAATELSGALIAVVPIVGRPLVVFTRIAGALLFIVVGVTLAKAAQYAAIDLLGAAIGRDAASFVGAAPVVLAAAILHRRYLSRAEQSVTRSQPAK